MHTIGQPALKYNTKRPKGVYKEGLYLSHQIVCPVPAAISTQQTAQAASLCCLWGRTQLVSSLTVSTAPDVHANTSKQHLAQKFPTCHAPILTVTSTDPGL
jgi:hypothetical protein